jgi:hypothetical protein
MDSGKNTKIVGKAIAVGIEQPNGVDRGIQLIWEAV